MLKRRRRWKRRRRDLGVAGAGWWERQVHQVATNASTAVTQQLDKVKVTGK